MHQLDVLLLVVGLLALCLGLVSRALRSVPISEPMVALLVGVAVGPVGLGLVDLAVWGDDASSWNSPLASPSPSA